MPDWRITVLQYNINITRNIWCKYLFICETSTYPVYFCDYRKWALSLSWCTPFCFINVSLTNQFADETFRWQRRRFIDQWQDDKITTTSTAAFIWRVERFVSELFVSETSTYPLFQCQRSQTYFAITEAEQQQRIQMLQTHQILHILHIIAA